MNYKNQLVVIKHKLARDDEFSIVLVLDEKDSVLVVNELIRVTDGEIAMRHANTAGVVDKEFWAVQQVIPSIDAALPPELIQ